MDDITGGRFIPAGAGNTHASQGGRWDDHGSSPQARGTRLLGGALVIECRFIPAGAGNTLTSERPDAAGAVHPRRRGEHGARRPDGLRLSGSSPQARGTPRRSSAGMPRKAVHPRRRGEHWPAPAASTASTGSSPQARGTPRSSSSRFSLSRFIPAGAGNTCSPRRRAFRPPVHPRRRGEHGISIKKLIERGGSSPQARGTRWSGRCRRGTRRFIPAGAGNTRRRPRASEQRAVHPRRRGEHLSMPPARNSSVGSSPQARGTRRRGSAGLRRQRFIPAGAGNTVVARSAARQAAVHPRRRGEH